MILQPDAQYGQTVTTFFIGLAPVNQIAHTRCRPHYASFMPCFYWGLSLILRVKFGQNPDEKQAVVSFDVTNRKSGDGPAV
ncbi:hypothetical protein CKO_03801 [Citrobacter koseri ATCC BAA-895]|uniref:Uncharacterized protein n=1 Tax=Citrobacter koseri (strain ATCC BAA-895 / CDC 4225-83 / SGSC4696) TaxID=290338 RepID=A8AN13_CITK8|nr:hypothetical protein CKO_03801 [Citrobacter koseri ATCC BAA-895]